VFIQIDGEESYIGIIVNYHKNNQVEIIRNYKTGKQDGNLLFRIKMVR